MNIVLYTPDLEPITVIDLPLSLLKEAENSNGVKLHIKRPFSIEFIEKIANNKFEDTEYITIKAKKIISFPEDTSNIVYITNDEELALTLMPEWLPGQRLRIQNYQGTIRWLISQLRHLVKKYNLDDNA
jgi:hypothetical protein